MGAVGPLVYTFGCKGTKSYISRDMVGYCALGHVARLSPVLRRHISLSATRSTKPGFFAEFLQSHRPKLTTLKWYTSRITAIGLVSGGVVHGSAFMSIHYCGMPSTFMSRIEQYDWWKEHIKKNRKKAQDWFSFLTIEATPATVDRWGTTLMIYG